jgi:predicted XRE-type DNA-binding protein
MTRPKTRPVSPALRALLADAIVEYLKILPLSQAQAAERLGIAQPRVNLLMRGQGASFSLDMLANLATRLGLTVHMNVTRPYRQR